MLKPISPRRWIAFAPALVFLLGAYVSLRYSLALWHADPDTSVPFNLWQGLTQHGLGFLTTWKYSPDNWLFTLLPLDAALLSLAPHQPTVVVLSGWGIFIASVALTGALLGQMTGRTAGLWLAAVLTFANDRALGGAGFLSYPVTHNISMLWGLASLWLCAQGLRTSSTPRAAAAFASAGVCLVLNQLSDPWAGAAITLPVTLVAGAVGAASWRDPRARRALTLCAIGGFVFVAAQTRGFGLLGFLSPSPLAFTNEDGLVQNAGWAFRAMASIANIIPLANPKSVAAMAISGLAAVGLIGAATAFALARLRSSDLPTRFTVGVCVTSVAAISGAFLVGQWPHGLMVGRFFPNAYFLGGLLLAWAASLHWSSRPAAAKLAAFLYPLLFVAAGLLSLPEAWTGRAPPRTNDDILQLAGFLDRQGLHYGYGPYWGAYALSMDWLSGGRTVIRPVTFQGGRIARRPWETSPYWYAASDEPPGTTERFLIVANDGEECPSVATCADEAIAQFGPVSRDMTYGYVRILVWRTPIAPRLAH